jgi:endoglucanase
VSGDQWQGNPNFVVLVDGKQVGGVQSVTANHGQGQWQDIAVTGDFAADLPHQVQVQFTNDAYGGTSATDRNLYVDWIDVNGHHFEGEAAASNTASLGKTVAGAAPMLVNGTLTFDTSPTNTSPTSDITAHVSGDSWNGSPQLALLVDGKQVGTASVTASHSAGAWQDVTFAGDFGAQGPQQLQVKFTNDAYGGSGSADRNLYVGSVDVNGHHFDGTKAESNTASQGHTAADSAVMVQNGTVSFNTAGSPPTAHADTLQAAASVDQTLAGTAHNETLAGGTQGVLTGSGGQNDMFTFHSLAEAGGTITDFNANGPEHSVLDLRPLMSAIGYQGSDPVADHVLAFTAQGTDSTAVTVTAPGSDHPVDLVTLQHVLPTAVASADYLWHA